MKKVIRYQVMEKSTPSNGLYGNSKEEVIQTVDTREEAVARIRRRRESNDKNFTPGFEPWVFYIRTVEEEVPDDIDLIMESFSSPNSLFTKKDIQSILHVLLEQGKIEVNREDS